MRYSLVLAGLAAMTTAAPMKHNDMADYTPYKKYTPYSAAVQAAAAKMETEKRSPMQMADDVKYTSYKPYANYEPYSAAVEALAAKMNMQKRHKLIFEPTDSMIAENDNMKRSVMHIDECLTKDNNMKRNMMHAEADENIPTSCSYKRMNQDDASMMTENTPNPATHGDINGGAYGKYEPYSKYSDYGFYRRATGTEDGKIMDSECRGNGAGCFKDGV